MELGPARQSHHHRPKSTSAASNCRRPRITIGIGAANRDPAQFPGPRLDIGANRTAIWRSLRHSHVRRDQSRAWKRVALSRFLRRFPRYAHRDPVRDGRTRFRGFCTSRPASPPDLRAAPSEIDVGYSGRSRAGGLKPRGHG
jgi:hypothetical protein